MAISKIKIGSTEHELIASGLISESQEKIILLDLEEKVGDGFEEITSAEIKALFANK